MFRRLILALRRSPDSSAGDINPLGKDVKNYFIGTIGGRVSIILLF
jgi:hypothetical protein